MGGGGRESFSPLTQRRRTLPGSRSEGGESIDVKSAGLRLDGWMYGCMVLM